MEQARDSLELLEADLENEIERWSLTKSEKAAILSRVHPTAKMDDLAHAQMLIECVPDDLEVKRRVFCQLDQSLPSEMIFVTNTSSLSISELAGGTSRQDRFLGMHFFTARAQAAACGTRARSPDHRRDRRQSPPPGRTHG